MHKGNKAVLFLVQYPKNVSPGQRFRFELYEETLHKNNFTVTTIPFIGSKAYPIIFKKGFLARKILAVLKGFIKMFILCFQVKKYDYIFVQLGITPVGPPFFEWVFVHLLKKKIIYDFDGAIWINQVSDNNKLLQLMRNASKVPLICKWAYKVSCGNDFLSNYARNFNKHVVYNPTCVDTNKHRNVLASHDVEKVTIGWTGSFSTLPYLKLIEPVLQKLQLTYDFNFKIICNQQPNLNIKNIEYVEWTAEKEVQELSGCQIGLMPLTQDEWSEGKCGFKLIQYLALEIPAVASPVGVNKKIVDEGVNGYLCDTENEWYKAIEKLILDKDLREKMGKEGRKKIINEYSLLSNADNFLSLFS